MSVDITMNSNSRSSGDLPTTSVLPWDIVACQDHPGRVWPLWPTARSSPGRSRWPSRRALMTSLDSGWFARNGWCYGKVDQHRVGVVVAFAAWSCPVYSMEMLGMVQVWDVSIKIYIYYICVFISGASACMPACLLLSRLALSLLNMDSIMHQIHSYYKSNTEYKRTPKSALVHELCKVLALMQDARTSAEVVPKFPPIEERHGQVPRYHALLFVAPLGH